MVERLKAHAWKACEVNSLRRFKSCSLRQSKPKSNTRVFGLGFLFAKNQYVSAFLGFWQAKVAVFRCSYRKLFPFVPPLKLGHFKAKTRRKHFLTYYRLYHAVFGKNGDFVCDKSAREEENLLFLFYFACV